MFTMISLGAVLLLGVSRAWRGESHPAIGARQPIRV